MDSALTKILREGNNVATIHEFPRSTEAPATLSLLFNCSVVYIVVGSVLILANTPIFINILRHRVLRAKKEYLLLAGTVESDNFQDLKQHPTVLELVRSVILF